MRPSYALWLLGLSIAGSGCALFEDTARNLVVGVKAPIEAHRENARNRSWAESAWQEVCMKDGTHSADYAEGFKDGFAEYLYRGGDGEPPLVAPLRYRDIRYQNAQGYQAIQDWFSGYRVGAAMARDSGARKWITGPSALPPVEHEPVWQEQPAAFVEGKVSPMPEPPPLPLSEEKRVPIPPIPEKPAIQPSPEVTREPVPVGPVQGGFGAPMDAAAPAVAVPPVVVVPPAEEPEPLKIKIMKVNGRPAAPPEPVRLKITKVVEATTVESEPQVEPEPAPERSELPEPLRQRIRAIMAPPTKD